MNYHNCNLTLEWAIAFAHSLQPLEHRPFELELLGRFLALLLEPRVGREPLGLTGRHHSSQLLERLRVHRLHSQRGTTRRRPWTSDWDTQMQTLNEEGDEYLLLLETLTQLLHIGLAVVQLVLRLREFRAKLCYIYSNNECAMAMERVWDTLCLNYLQVNGKKYFICKWSVYRLWPLRSSARDETPARSLWPEVSRTSFSPFNTQTKSFEFKAFWRCNLSLFALISIRT